MRAHTRSRGEHDRESMASILWSPLTPSMPSCASVASSGQHGHSASADFSYALAAVLIVGVFVSYFVQDWKIIQLKTSRGISWLSIILACVSTCSNTINILVLRWDLVQCCHNSWDAATCSSELLPVIQISAGFISTFIFYILLVVYFPRTPDVGSGTTSYHAINADADDASETSTAIIASSDYSASDFAAMRRVPASGSSDGESHSQYRPSRPSSGQPHQRRQPYLDENAANSSFRGRVVALWTRFARSYSAARWAFVVYIALNIVLGGGLAWYFLSTSGVDTKATTNYALVLGGISTAAIVVQWTPQLIMTFRAGEVGSLSVGMLLLQAPGSFLVVVFELMYHESVSTWMPFFMTGVQQLILLGMCVWFWARDKYFKKKKSADEASVPILSDVDT